MKGYSNLGVVPTIGIEAEVQGWNEPFNANRVSERLYKMGAMPQVYMEKNHNWHCGCPTCNNIGGYVNTPVQWKRQNDGTLAPGGAEFISSRFPVIQEMVDDAILALGILGEDAFGPDYEFYDKYDRPSEVGLHIHASVPLPHYALEKNILRDTIKIFYLYYPELVRLSSAYGRCRSIHYRWPKYDLNKHHNFLTIAHNNHLEWRLFEADLTNEVYMRGALWTAAALTRVMRAPRIMHMLEAVGSRDRWDLDLFDNIYEFDKVRDVENDGDPIDERSSEVLDAVVDAFDITRFNALETVVMSMLDGNEDSPMVEAMFGKARSI